MSSTTANPTDQLEDAGEQHLHLVAPADLSHDAAAADMGITPQIMAVIEEAATAFLGRKVRILSVKLKLHPDVESSSWADQGRDVLQTSHNLVQRRH